MTGEEFPWSQDDLNEMARTVIANGWHMTQRASTKTNEPGDFIAKPKSSP
jgi:hypothetical protein